MFDRVKASHSISVALLIVLSTYVHLPVQADQAGRWQGGVLPDSLAEDVFGALIRDMSEPGGEYYSDNYTSNESSYLHPIETIRRLRISGGVYVGVGPEQNFTYIAETNPEMAFIIDIRRQNMLQHLIFKALFNLSETRVDFLSRLLSKPLDEDLTFFTRLFRQGSTLSRSDTAPTISEMVVYFDSVDSVRALYDRNLQDVKILVKTYGIETEEDMQTIETIYRAFYDRQLDIQYDLSHIETGKALGFTPPPLPNLRDLLLSKTTNGEFACFLANEESFSIVKGLHKRNLIVPVVGDFKGDMTLRAIADFVRKHESVVSVFYTSNVEMYLATQLPSNGLFKFRDNVLAMPIDDNSVFIRAFHNGSFSGMSSHPSRIDDHLFTTLVQPMSHFIEDSVWQSDIGTVRLYLHTVNTGNVK